MELTFYHNGELLRSTELHISAFDQAFLYGEGITEPILVRNRKLLLAEKHFDRFFRGASTIGLDLRVTEKIIEKTIMTLLDLNSMNDCMVRLIATKGDSSGYFYEDVHSLPTFLMMTLPLKFFSEKLYYMGVTLKTSSWRDISPTSFYHDIRTLSAMNRRVNYREAKEEGNFDSLMINIEGYVTQCTGSNIFLVKERTLITPDLSCGIFPGVTREYVLYDVARELNLDTYEGFILQHNVINAEECFITSTEAGVLPVAACDGEKIGTGRPGRITKMIQEYFTSWYKSTM
ncbi:MAG: aminotransferase class IV [Candidatus Aureabacteria bacterium]|nr:aminotransferase class IV [Candidatus Auribacterota bacterium]